MSPAEVRALLARHGLAPARERGQNFLCDEALAAKLVRLAGVEPTDHVIEVGTGLGVLTRALAARARSVLSIEVDAGLVRALRAERLLPANVALRHADAVGLDLAGLAQEAGGPLRFVANLPYSVATPLLRRLLDPIPQLRAVAVMVQREVAERIGAEPGSRSFGSLSVLHRLCLRVDSRLDLHPRCFYPVPSVTSTFLVMSPLAERPGAAELAAVERVARAGFAHRRKQLANSLRQALGLDAETVQDALAATGLAPELRAEALTPAQWQALTAALPAPEPERP